MKRRNPWFRFWSCGRVISKGLWWSCTSKHHFGPSRRNLGKQITVARSAKTQACCDHHPAKVDGWRLTLHDSASDLSQRLKGWKNTYSKGGTRNSFNLTALLSVWFIQSWPLHLHRDLNLNIENSKTRNSKRQASPIRTQKEGRPLPISSQFYDWSNDDLTATCSGHSPEMITEMLKWKYSTREMDWHDIKFCNVRGELSWSSFWKWLNTSWKAVIWDIWFGRKLDTWLHPGLKLRLLTSNLTCCWERKF